MDITHVRAVLTAERERIAAALASLNDLEWQYGDPVTVLDSVTQAYVRLESAHELLGAALARLGSPEAPPAEDAPDIGED